jgi:hypothetical protein
MRIGRLLDEEAGGENGSFVGGAAVAKGDPSTAGLEQLGQRCPC